MSHRHLIFRVYKTEAELQRLRERGLRHVAARGACARFALFLMWLVTFAVTLVCVIFFGVNLFFINDRLALVQTMMVGLVQGNFLIIPPPHPSPALLNSPPGFLTELFLKPALLKTAYLFATGHRKRVVGEQMLQIRNEVESMLNLRAIKSKQRLKFEFAAMPQLPQLLLPSSPPTRTVTP